MRSGLFGFLILVCPVLSVVVQPASVLAQQSDDYAGDVFSVARLSSCQPFVPVKGDDSAALQFAITECFQLHRKGNIYIPQGNFRISQPIIVPSGIDLVGTGKHASLFHLYKEGRFIFCRTRSDGIACDRQAMGENRGNSSGNFGLIAQEDIKGTLLWIRNGINREFRNISVKCDASNPGRSVGIELSNVNNSYFSSIDAKRCHTNMMINSNSNINTFESMILKRALRHNLRVCSSCRSWPAIMPPHKLTFRGGVYEQLNYYEGANPNGSSNIYIQSGVDILFANVSINSGIPGNYHGIVKIDKEPEWDLDRIRFRDCRFRYAPLGGEYGWRVFHLKNTNERLTVFLDGVNTIAGGTTAFRVDSPKFRVVNLGRVLTNARRFFSTPDPDRILAYKILEGFTE